MLKSLEIKQEHDALKAEIEALINAKTEVPAEKQAKLAELQGAYAKAKAEENERKAHSVNGGVKMNNTRAMKNAILKNLMLGVALTEEMKASGLVPKYVSEIGSKGQVEGVNNRGGYLVDEEFLEIDKRGGEVLMIPAREIYVSKPTGKIPTVDFDQAKTTGDFLVPVDELAEITKTHGIFSQIQYTCEKRGGIIPISNELLEDADSDVIGIVRELFQTCSDYQKNADIIKAVGSISGITTQYLGSGVTFESKAGVKVFTAVIRGTLKGANRRNAKVVMCDSDFAKLAQAQMSNGEFYLKPMATDPSRYMIEGVEVLSVDDSLFTTTSDNVTTVGGYCFVGNWNRVAYINRKGLEIASDASAGFTTDALFIRGIKRAVAKVLEDGAFVKVSEGAAPVAG